MFSLSLLIFAALALFSWQITAVPLYEVGAYTGVETPVAILDNVYKRQDPYDSYHCYNNPNDDGCQGFEVGCATNPNANKDACW